MKAADEKIASIITVLNEMLRPFDTPSYRNIDSDAIMFGCVRFNLRDLKNEFEFLKNLCHKIDISSLLENDNSELVVISRRDYDRMKTAIKLASEVLSITESCDAMKER